VGRTRNARFGLKASGKRKNLPRDFRPDWSPEVAELVEREKAAVRDTELLGLIEKTSGGAGAYLQAELAFEEVQRGDVYRLAQWVRWDAGFLRLGPAILAVRWLRAQVFNATGPDQLERARAPLRELGEALVGILDFDEPGYSRWFRSALRKEYEATHRKAKKGQPKAGVTPREQAVKDIADRFSATTSMVEDWLKPSRDPEKIREAAARRAMRTIIEGMKKTPQPDLLGPYRRKSRRRRRPAHPHAVPAAKKRHQ